MFNPASVYLKPRSLNDTETGSSMMQFELTLNHAFSQFPKLKPNSVK